MRQADSTAAEQIKWANEAKRERMIAEMPDGMMDYPIPEALYGCSDESCATEVSYPADMLRWFGGTDRAGWLWRAGWYCTESCADDIAYVLRDHYGEDVNCLFLPNLPWDTDKLVGPLLSEVLAARASLPPVGPGE